MQLSEKICIKTEVQLIFERCTLYFRKFAIVPYEHPFFKKLSGPCTCYDDPYPKTWFLSFQSKL